MAGQLAPHITAMANHINWDEYFMFLAILVSLRSKDPNTKVGAVLVKNNKVLGTGYNGFPSGCDESRFSWSRDTTAGWLDTKYPYVIHAEANALLNTVAAVAGGEIYVTQHPCNECAKLLIQGGVRRITFLDNKHLGTESYAASQKLFAVTGVEIRHLAREHLRFDAVQAAFGEYAKLPEA